MSAAGKPRFSIVADSRYGHSLREARTIVTIAGVLDRGAASAVRDALENLDYLVTIDLAAVRHLDSSILIEFTRFAERIAPMRATLVGLQPQVWRLFEIIQCERMFWIADGAYDYAQLTQRMFVEEKAKR